METLWQQKRARRENRQVEANFIAVLAKQNFTNFKNPEWDIFNGERFV